MCKKANLQVPPYSEMVKFQARTINHVGKEPWKTLIFKEEGGERDWSERSVRAKREVPRRMRSTVRSSPVRAKKCPPNLVFKSRSLSEETSIELLGERPDHTVKDIQLCERIKRMKLVNTSY